MKISISQWAFPGDWKINKCFNLAKKSGFMGEMNLDKSSRNKTGNRAILGSIS